MHQQGNIADYVRDRKRRRLEFALLDKRANLPDDFTCAVVVLDEVPQYLAHFFKIDWLRRHEALSRLRVAQDRGQRLVQLMRERTGKLSKSRDARQVRKLLPVAL